MSSVCVLTFVCLAFSLPIYVLKKMDVQSGSEVYPQYATHRHMYNWLWTMAFISGTTPAVILLAMCMVTLLYINIVMNFLGGASDVKQKRTPSREISFIANGVVSSQHPHLILSIWIIFILNVAVVGTVNGLYLWSTLLDLASSVRMWIQFLFGLFSFLWSVTLRLGLPSQITESNSGVWLFTCLNVMNSVVIPCIVTALSSPSCYQVQLIFTMFSLFCV